MSTTSPLDVGRPPAERFRRLKPLDLAVLCLLLLLPCGCSLVRHGASATKSMAVLLDPKTRQAPTDELSDLQSVLMREADRYVSAVAQAADAFQTSTPTPEARLAGMQWKVLQGTSAFVDASGENPKLNAVDLAVLASLSCQIVGTFWIDRFGDAARPLLETHLQLETNAWANLHGVLDHAQREELRRMVNQYSQLHPNNRYVLSTSLANLVGLLDRASQGTSTTRPGSIFSALYLNPLAALDPATQSIERARLLAQRALFYAQRAPTLLGWQVELTTFQLALQPEAQQLLADVSRLSDSSQAFARLAEGFPSLVNQQREAGINQLLAGLATERSNILASLSSQENQLSRLLPEVRDTLKQGESMAAALNTAIQSLDTFVRYVSPPATNTPPTVSDTNNRPFNVLDYGTAAGQIGAMAGDLHALLEAVSQQLPNAATLGRQASDKARATVNHAFRLAVVFLLLATFLVPLSLLSYRLLLRRLRLSPTRQPDPEPVRVEGRVPRGPDFPS